MTTSPPVLLALNAVQHMLQLEGIVLIWVLSMVGGRYKFVCQKRGRKPKKIGKHCPTPSRFENL